MSANKPCQALTKLVVALLVPVFAVIALVHTFSSEGSDPALLTQEQIESRIAPIAQYNTGAPALVLGGEKKEPLAGDAVYKNVCMTCHEAGLAGAPKKGDSAAWAPRIAQGEDTLFNHALHGLNGMPAKGGNPSLSDLEVKRAVVFMANASGGKLAEPADGGSAPAADAPKAETKPAPEAPKADASPAAEAPKTEEAAPAAAPQVEAKPATGGDIEKGKSLANDKACTACHSVDNKVVGPAFKDVAAKYGNDTAHIIASIKGGSSGRWGAIPMAPNPVSDEEAAHLAAWISSLK